jgi:hypothetical protein
MRIWSSWTSGFLERRRSMVLRPSFFCFSHILREHTWSRVILSLIGIFGPRMTRGIVLESSFVEGTPCWWLSVMSNSRLPYFFPPLLLKAFRCLFCLEPIIQTAIKCVREKKSAMPNCRTRDEVNTYTMLVSLTVFQFVSYGSNSLPEQFR